VRRKHANARRSASTAASSALPSAPFPAIPICMHMHVHESCHTHERVTSHSAPPPAPSQAIPLCMCMYVYESCHTHEWGVC